MDNLHEAAPALLGSTLLANEEKLDSSKPGPVSSGNDTIDEQALDGGFRYGEITSVAGANGTGKTLVSLGPLKGPMGTLECGMTRPLLPGNDPRLGKYGLSSTAS